MKILRIAAIGILLLGSILALVPMIWLILATFRANDRVFSEVFTVTKPTLANYTDLFTTVPFFQFLANSTFLACTAVSWASCSPRF
jgi:ABC-type glycerol-3-phosphate transport system permease component